MKDGVVTRILDEYSILINVGRKDGVRKGKELEVFEPGETILDPESGDELGTLDFIKSTLEVVQVYDNFSTCQSITYEEVSVGLAASFISPLERTKTKRTIRSLDIDENDIQPQKVKERHIKVGDPVRFID